MEALKCKNLFDFSQTIAKELLEEKEYPWEILSEISSPTIAFPLIKAQCRISASFPMIAGP